MRWLRSARGIVAEVRQARRRLVGTRSFLRYTTDILLYRALHFVKLPGKDRPRKVQLGEGVEVSYRLNRGDIQTIREVWIEECYRPPVDVPVRTVVDLGTNIALTSLWYAKTYGASTLVCVEPGADNARLARENLRRNGVEADFLEAAVAPTDGKVSFQADESANLGQVGTGSAEVTAVSMATVLELLPDGRDVDLLKMDIEGAEEAVLRGDLRWLDRVRSLIVEFHPDRVDHAGLIEILEGQGFRYVPAGAARWNSMDFFVKDLR